MEAPIEKADRFRSAGMGSGAVKKRTVERQVRFLWDQIINKERYGKTAVAFFIISKAKNTKPYQKPDTAARQ